MEIFSFNSYKEYLNQYLAGPAQGRGSKSRLAQALNCQSGFITQVLSGHTHFSLEHGLKINSYCEHPEEAAHFFLLLLQKERSGNAALEKYFQKQIQEILDKRKQIHQRINVNSEISEKEYARYYSQWHYAAVHILTAIPEFRTKAAIARKLGLGEKLCGEILTFLCELGLVSQSAKGFEIGTARIHLQQKSPLLSRHHVNWRLEAMKALDRNRDDDLHYSAVFALSKVDIDKIRETLLQAIRNAEVILKKSGEEELIGVAIDLFQYN